MAHIVWTDDLSVGIKIIDEQHLKLIGYINTLEDWIQSGESQSLLYKVIIGLELYASIHFDTEENLMKMHKYEASNAHLAEHKRFIITVRKFRADFDTGNTKISEDIHSFLNNWLMNHILKTDKELGSELVRKGAE